MKTKLNDADVENNITTIRKTGAEFAALVHVTAVAALTLLEASARPDTGQIRRLLEAMPLAARPKALAVWFAEFSPVAVIWDGQEVGSVKLRKEGDKQFHAFAFDKADETPFWVLTPERDPAPLTLEAMQRALRGIIARYQKAAEDGKFDPSKGSKASAGRLVKKIQGILEGDEALATANG